MGPAEVLAVNTWKSADIKVRKALDQFPEGRKKKHWCFLLLVEGPLYLATWKEGLVANTCRKKPMHNVYLLCEQGRVDTDQWVSGVSVGRARIQEFTQRDARF